VSDPANCPATNPTNFPGQDCSPQMICGDASSIAQCYATDTLTAPASTATSNTDQDSGACVGGACNGGYLVNCFATGDSVSPKCDSGGSYWCDRNSTCYTTKVRDTTCTANLFGVSTCGNCRTGYQDCVGDDVCEVTTGSTNYPTGTNNNYAAGCTCACDSGYGDCDSSGCSDSCETQFNIDNCIVGNNNNIPSCGNCVCDTGYQDCDASGAGAGNGCEVQTGVTSCTTGGGAPGMYSIGCGCTALPSVDIFANLFNISFGNSYLWGQQSNPSGSMLNLSNASGSKFIIDNMGCIIFPDGGKQCTIFEEFDPYYFFNPLHYLNESYNGSWINDTINSINNLSNNSIENLAANALQNNTLARVGNCGNNFAIQNITNGSVECVPIQPVLIMQTYQSSVLTKTDGEINRSMSLSINPIMVTIDGIIWQNDIDYIINSSGLTLLNKVWNQQIIQLEGY
jgi:hypothetical protein